MRNSPVLTTASQLKTVGTFLIIALSGIVLVSCSTRGGSDTIKSDAKHGEAQTASAPAAADAAMADDLPPALQTPWKGDLDEIVKRRVVRVLLPFRRPEFFYVDGRPAGILQEAFQELERTLNTKYKTNAANRIIVALLPVPTDKLRERMAGGYGDLAAYGISITEENSKIADFTIPTLSGLKMIVVAGPGAPELKTIEDLSGK